MDSLKIAVSKQDMTADVAKCRTISIREKILNRLFGAKHEMILLIPGNRIQEMTVQTTDSQPEADT